MPDSIRVLESSGARDVAFSADQKRVYVSDTSGNIRVFDVATGNQVASWHVSDRLGAISVSTDGSFLLASDPRQPLLYKVSTTTGAVLATIAGTGTAYLDVQIVDATTAIATGSKPTSINLADNSLTPLANASYYNGQSYLTKDHYLTLLGESGTSNGPLFLYDSRTHAVVARGDDYQSTATGFNFGVQAVSESAGEVVQGIYSTTLNIYDLNIKFIKSVNLGVTITGIAFDQSGAHIYVAETPAKGSGAGTVVEYDAATFNTVATYAAGTLGSVNSSNTNYGNNLLLSTDSRYLAVTDPAAGSVKLIDTQGTAYSTISGTDAADTLTGTTSDDTILAGAGNDTINASKGQDYVDGGTGTDTLIVRLDGPLFDPVQGPVTYTVTGSSAGSGTITSSAGGLNTSFTSLEAIAITGIGDGGDKLVIGGYSGRTSATLGNGNNAVSVTGSTGAVTLKLGSGNDVVALGTSRGSVYVGLGANTVTGGAGATITTAVDSHVAPAMVTAGANGTAQVTYLAADGSAVTSTVDNTGNTGATQSTRNTLFIVSGVAGQGLNVDASHAPAAVTFQDGPSDDVLIGSHYADAFYSYDGLPGQSGSGGNDVKVGNGGADDFDYSLAAPTNLGDHIADFDADDVLDFSYYGGTVASASDPAVQVGDLTFIGTAAFDGGARELRYEAHDGKTYVQVDLDGDRIADGQVTIDNGAFTLVDTQVYGGRNQLQIATAQTATSGTDGAETLAGTSGSDTIRAYDGNDTILLSTGQDFIDGGAGYDVVTGTIAGGRAYTISNDRIDGGDLATALLNIEGISLQAGGTGAVQVDAHTATITVAITGGAGDDTLTGGAGNDLLDGGDGDDFITTGAGHDTVLGGAGNDGIAVGAFLDPLDRIDGGSGTNDQVGLDGDYTGANALVLQDATLTNVEVLAVLPGHSYDVTSADGNVAAGQTFTVFGSNLGAGDSFTFNGSAETDGNFLIYGGLGQDTLTGGANADGFFFGPDKFGPTDVVHGGGGVDQLGLDGHTAALTLDSTHTDVEVVALLKGPAGFDPDTYGTITVDDSWVAAGQTKTITAVTAFQTSIGPVSTALVIDGSHETDGSLNIYAGSGDDRITGGAGADHLYGGLGADTLTGGAGADVFLYNDARESTGATFDTIADFTFGTDTLSIYGQGSDDYASVTGGQLDKATFDADLQAAVAGQLSTGHAVVFTPDAGSYAGQTFLIVDANGAAGYQMGGDYVIHLSAPPATLSGHADFITG